MARPPSATMAFAAPQPCPPTENISLPLDTMLLSAGQHQLQVVVTDAAGDQATAYDGTITTSGPSTIGVNGGSIGGAGVANGQSPCAGEALELAVNGKTKAACYSVRQGSHGEGRAALRHSPDPQRPDRPSLRWVARPARRSTALCRPALDGSFSYKVPTGPDRSLGFSIPRTATIPAPPRPQPPRS